MRAIWTLSLLIGISSTTSAFADDNLCGAQDTRFAAYKHWFNKIYLRKSTGEIAISTEGALPTQAITPGAEAVPVKVGHTNFGKPLAFTWSLAKNDDLLTFDLSRNLSSGGTLGFTISLCAYAADSSKRPPGTGYNVPDATYFRPVFASTVNYFGGRRHPIKGLLTLVEMSLITFVPIPRSLANFASVPSKTDFYNGPNPNLAAGVTGNVVYVAVLTPQSKVRTFEGTLRVSETSEACKKLYEDERVAGNAEYRATNSTNPQEAAAAAQRNEARRAAYSSKLKSLGCES